MVTLSSSDFAGVFCCWSLPSQARSAGYGHGVGELWPTDEIELALAHHPRHAHSFAQAHGGVYDPPLPRPVVQAISRSFRRGRRPPSEDDHDERQARDIPHVGRFSLPLSSCASASTNLLRCPAISKTFECIADLSALLHGQRSGPRVAAASWPSSSALALSRRPVAGPTHRAERVQPTIPGRWVMASGCTTGLNCAYPECGILSAGFSSCDSCS